MLFRKSKRVKRFLKRLGYENDAKRLKELELLADRRHAKMILAENNLADMRKKYKALAEQYLDDQERWKAIEVRLKTLTGSQSKQSVRAKKRTSTRSAQKSRKK